MKAVFKRIEDSKEDRFIAKEEKGKVSLELFGILRRRHQAIPNTERGQSKCQYIVKVVKGQSRYQYLGSHSSQRSS